MRVAIPLEQCWHEVPGGTALTSIDLARALDARDDLEVIGVAARHREPPPPPFTPPVPVRHLPLPRLLLYETWHGLRYPDVEAATGPVDLLHVVGGAVAAARVPMVVTIHDLAFLHHPDYFTRHGLRFFHRALDLTRRFAARVMVPSQATLDDCVRAGIAADRLVHVPWGVTVGTVGPDAIAAARARFGLDGPYVVMVGTLEPRKNLLGALEAWRRLDRPDARFVVVGPSGWGDAVDPSSIPENVSITGFVDEPVRDALLAGADASLYPSLFEGFGLPVLEAMALGCPVITSSGTSTEELVDGGAGVAVDPRDPDAIAAALSTVLDDRTHRDELVRAGLERAAAYTWERAAELTVATYREVA